MARAQPQEIKLPWRETVDGAVAELGAVFRVEIVGGDWRCSVKSGRCQTIIAKGLKTQTEGKRRAQAHAATMPEVREAAEEGAADAKPGAKKSAPPRRPRKTRAESQEKVATAPEPTPAPPPAPSPAAASSAITFRETEDGCLCGKTQGVCWVANAEEVALARPLPEAVKEEIAAAVAQHYAAKKAASETSATTVAAPAAKKVARKVAKKAAAKKTAKTRPAREQKPAREPAPQASPAKGRKAGRGRASKKAAKGKRASQKEEAPVNGKAKDVAAASAKPATAKRQAKREPQAAAPSGPIAWSEVEGKPRGVAAHGTFLIEPEGQAFGLYFADPSGQSRHLRSGTVPELRRAAEEFAARGEPAPLRDAPSRDQDEALMRIFASGAVEG